LADAIANWGHPKIVKFNARLDGTEQRYVIQRPSGFDTSKTAPLLDCSARPHGADRWQFVLVLAVNVGRRAAAAGKVSNGFKCLPIIRAMKERSWMGPGSGSGFYLQIFRRLNLRYTGSTVIV